MIYFFIILNFIMDRKNLKIYKKDLNCNRKLYRYMALGNSDVLFMFELLIR